MRTRVFSALGLVASVLTFWAATGCSIIPEAKEDPTRFYVLTSASPAAAPVANASVPALHLRPIQLADYLRTRAMIVRRENNEIDFRDFARWGEALGPGIGRVLREELLARGAAGAVSFGRVKNGGTDNSRDLSVRVLTCEGLADGSLRFHASWEIAATGGGAPLNGEYRAANLKWDGQNEGSLATALSEAVAGLAGEIAARLAQAKN